MNARAAGEAPASLLPAADASSEDPRPAAAATVDEFAAAIEAWRARLGAAGVACRAVACHCADARWTRDFAGADSALSQAWAALRARVSPEQPVALGQVEGGAGRELLMATVLQLPGGERATVGIVLAPPHNERVIQLVLLALGWLQLALSSASLVHNQRAARLLDVLGHVASQGSSRAAAQEWINRMAAWARGEVATLSGAFTLMLFQVRDGSASWWVGADTAWAETASPAVQAAGEAAAQALAEACEVDAAPWWALPILDDGRAVAVLVARYGESSAQSLPPELADVLRASAGLGEPLLRRWRQAERSLPAHAVDASREAWRKLSGPGHLTWKAAAALVVVVSAVLLLWPVTDRVTANATIEGRVRRLVTAPFEGFVAQSFVRAGQRVRQGDALLRLDDRDLKLEQGRFRSERDQAALKLRQAMAERDAPALALAAAELQQAEAQLALVDTKIARAELTAPLDGLVVSGDWVQQIGAPVEVGKEMFEIAGSDGFRVVLHVPDRTIARVGVGQHGSLRLTAQPHVVHAFTVTNVTATASVQDGSNGFRVEAAWDGAAPVLSPGMQGVGKIEVGKASLLTIWTRSSIDWLRIKLWSWWW